MINKKIIILVLCLAVMTVISGCGKKEVKMIIEDNKQEVNQEQNNEKKVEEQKEKKEDIEKIPTSIDEIDISDWQTYQGEVYSLDFPNNFILSKHPMLDEADIIIQPKNSLTYNYPSLNIMYKSSSGTSFEIQKNYYLNWSYINKIITKQLVNGKNVWTLIGKLRNMVNVKNIIFSNDNNIFIFSIQYEDKDSDTAKIFDKIIDSFKLK